MFEATNAVPAAADAPNPMSMAGRIEQALRSIYDPEIPVNIYELGLIYGVEIEPSGDVRIKMTLTAPSCPEAMSLPAKVESTVREVSGVKDVQVEVVWEPQWTMEKMSDAAKLQLGML